MSNDQGVRTGKRGVPWVWVIVAVVALAAITMFGVSWWIHRPGQIATAKEFTPEGPPCPTLTAEAFVAGAYKARQLSEYDDIAFARHSGDMSCNEIKTHGGTGLGIIPVCQFTTPGILTVTPPKGQTVYFNPGIGKPATVSVQDGVAKCVVASNFKLGDD